MKPLRVACLLLSMVLGEVRVTVAGYGIQPVDAVLFIDGAPTYLRLTNSTSLETVYSCVLENSQNVNSVIMSTQIKGVQMDVGQVEENVNEVIRLLSAEAASNGRTLWKSPEELKLFKTRLARYLTSNYYDSRPILEPDMYLNFKSQRSADWLHNSRGQQSLPNFHPMHPGWGEQSYVPREPRRQLPIPAAIYGSATYFNPSQSIGQGIALNTPFASAFIPTATPIPDRAPTPAVTFSHRNVTATESPAPSGSAERHTTSNSPSVSPPGQSDSLSSTTQPTPVGAPVNQHNSSDRGLHPLKSMYASLFSLRYGKIESEVTTAVEQEVTTISVEGLSDTEKSKMTVADKDVAQTSENEKSFEEEVESRSVSRRRFKTERIDFGGNVTDNSDRAVADDGHSPHVALSDESSTESEKPKKSKGKRRNGKKRVAKARQQSSVPMSDPKENRED